MRDKKTELINYFKDAVCSEKCSINIEGNKEKGDGFLSDIIFATVTLEDGKILRLVAKVSKSAQEMREFSSDLCQREIKFYDEIVPIFQQFQANKNIKDPFNALPKCYKTYLKENCEIIIQDNMVAQGFKLHNRRIPMNLNHIKLALRNYAKFHGISFAIKDQNPEIFKEIESNFVDLVSGKIPKLEVFYEKRYRKVINNIRKVNKEDLADRYQKLINKSLSQMLLDILNDVPDEKVLLHGDCHNGNFLFKYENDDESNPMNMVMLDFQVAFCFSPIIDLSIFLLTNASKTELLHFKELMEYYHNELSAFLRESGSDPDKLFPIATMWDHWKRYSFYGFNSALCILELLFVEPEDVIEVDDKNSINNLLDVNLKDETVYLQRLVDLVEQYLHFLEIY